MNKKISSYPKLALITGASSGIGKAFAFELAQKGFDLVMTARSQDKLLSLSKEIKSIHPEISIEILQADLSTTDGITEVTKSLEEKEVGLFINNAGFGQFGDFCEMNVNRLDSMISLNCQAAMRLSQAFLKRAYARKNGGMIITASCASFIGTPGYALYSATKAFDLMLGESLWYEARKYNVDVLALCPGYTKTDFQNQSSDPGISGMSWKTPESLVRFALKKLGKTPSAIHGRRNKALQVFTNLLPRKFSISLIGKMFYNKK